MVRAIVFDCFGVLASDGWLPYRDKYFSNDPILLEKAMSMNKDVDAGRVTYDDFIKEVAVMASLPENIARADIENNIPNNDLFTYIKDELKPGYKIGMLSNAGANWLDHIFTPDQVALFDATAISYELGFIKPDPRTYHAIAERLDVNPDECVFIDDQPKYCDGASQVGMQAIRYLNFTQIREDLAKIIN